MSVHARAIALVVAVLGLLLAACAPSAPSVPRDASVFWVFAHPDDEVLAAGGAIFEQSTSGRHRVIILTDGEATIEGPRLGLSEREVREARRREARAALSVVGLDEITFAGLPDEGVTGEAVVEVLEPILARARDPVLVRGHSPLDAYVGECGHPDHCATGRALVELSERGLIDGLELYRLGHLFGGERSGSCEPLSEPAMQAKQAMRAEYARRDESAGRYGIGARSVTEAWQLTETEPECRDAVPGSVAVGETGGLVTIAVVAFLMGVALFAIRSRSARPASSVAPRRRSRP